MKLPGSLQNWSPYSIKQHITLLEFLTGMSVHMLAHIIVSAGTFLTYFNYMGTIGLWFYAIYGHE